MKTDERIERGAMNDLYPTCLLVLIRLYDQGKCGAMDRRGPQKQNPKRKDARKFPLCGYPEAIGPPGEALKRPVIW